MLLGLVDVGYVLVALPPAELVTREAHVVYTLGHFAAIGLICAAASRLASGWRPRPRFAAAGVLALAVGSVALHPDLQGPARRLAARLGGGERALAGALMFVFAASLPAALAVGSWLSKSPLRWLSVGVAIAVGIHNQLIYRFDNPGVHLFYAAGAASLMAASLAPALPSLAKLRDKTRALSRVLTGVVLLAIAYTLALVPGNLVLVDMSRASGSVLFPYWSRVHAQLGGEQAQAVEGLGPWFVDRSEMPDVPPTAGVRPDENPIVLLIGIDALRADVFADPRAATLFPNLHALRQRSVEFTQARSPGAATVYTMAMMFSGKYFSQLYWSLESVGGSSDYWPHEDETQRFPERLASAEVATYTASPTFWFTNELGLMRGFSEQEIVDEGESLSPRGASHWSSSRHVIDRLIARLDRQPHRLFGFVHLLEPHAPYDAHGVPARGPFARYLAEIAHVDVEIGRLLAAIEARGLAGRTTIILFSDHGEAFGDHGAILHATTLYEEQLRVPFWIALPNGEHRLSPEPVTLMDLGPTILDLFGLSAPGHHMGESLGPILRGEESRLTRPLVAEGRRMQAMVFGDGIKVIRNIEAGTVEVYSLRDDPGELRNLYAGPGSEFDDHLSTLEAFFAVHTLQREGYEVPLRK